MSGNICRLVGTVGLLLVTARPAMAQSFTDLQQTLRPGDTVYVTDAAGVETKGSVAGVESSVLRVKVDDIERTWAVQDLREVYRSGDSLWQGTVVGMISGGVLGAAGGSILRTLFESEGANGTGAFLYVLGLGIGGGAAIGAGIDALIPGRTLVYRERRRSLSIQPVISPSTRGVRLALRF